MNFKHSAFINRNTPELREYLEMLGYVIAGSHNNSNLDSIFTNTGSFSDPVYCFCHSIEKKYFTLEEKGVLGGRIDCSDNEELFKAIVAINDKNDYMQWFVSDIDFVGADWILCDIQKFEDHGLNKYTTWHKATLEELINHFKK